MKKNSLCVKSRLLIICALLCWGPPSWCDAVSSALQAKLNAIHTMSATFQQVVYAQKREVSRSSGTMALSRPGHFRWQTQKPLEQWVIADGNHLWVYDLDLEQVTVKKQDKGLGSTAGLFLSGYNGHIAEDFNVTVKTQGDISRFDLRAKSSKANFQQVRLMFNKNALAGIELFDQLGQHTDIHLSQIKTNPTLPAALFQFKVPENVDVVEQ